MVYPFSIYHKKIDLYKLFHLKKMTDFKIGQHVYEIFNPNNNGLVTQIDGDNIIVDTQKGKKKYDKSRITMDYHIIIKDILERVDEWKELWFQKKAECDELRKSKNIYTACGN